MKMENQDKFETKMKGLGFREPEDFKKIQNDTPKVDGDFTTRLSKTFENKEIDFDLQLKKKDNNLYLNKITTNHNSVKLETNPHFTAKEMFNLTEGRSVNKDFYNKEGIKNNAWVKLETKENNKPELTYYNQNYGYDLETAIKKYPQIKIPEEHLQSAIQSLKKGNAQIVRNDKNETLFIQANPVYKNLNINNEKGEKMFQKKNGENFEIGNPIKKVEQKKPVEKVEIKVPGAKVVAEKLAKTKTKKIKNTVKM